jgi:hypothetical protein
LPDGDNGVSPGALPATLRTGIIDMTLLMHTNGPFERARHSSPQRDRVPARPAAAYLAMIKRFCLGALTVLAAGAALAAVIALKAALFFWVYHYY